MQDIQPELIEKYQILLERDPRSQLFAPLTEAYRKMGLLEEAFRIAVRGVQFNPNFGGGRIALAKVFLDRENLQGAIDELEKARDLSPDNILAHTLLGDSYLKSKRPKDALRSYKMVLFLAPNNEKAQRVVRKLESLTADEFDEDVFEMRPLQATQAVTTEPVTDLKPVQAVNLSVELERILSLCDAYIVRNDMERALATLQHGERNFGAHPEFNKRFKIINHRNVEDEGLAAAIEVAPPPPRHMVARQKKIEFLQNLLRRIHPPGT